MSSEFVVFPQSLPEAKVLFLFWASSGGLLHCPRRDIAWIILVCCVHLKGGSKPGIFCFPVCQPPRFILNLLQHQI